MDTRSQVIQFQYHIAGYDSSLYAIERVFVNANDGIKIPISIDYKKSTLRKPNPLLL